MTSGDVPAVETALVFDCVSEPTGLETVSASNETPAVNDAAPNKAAEPAEAEATTRELPVREKLITRAAAATACVALLASGCKPTSTEDKPVHVNPTAITRTYPKLPHAVSLEVGASNKDTLFQPEKIYEGGKVTDKTVEISYGSGVFMDFGDSVIDITAAHVVAGSDTHCENVFLDARTATNSNGIVYQVARQDSAAPVVHYGPDYNNGHDVAVQLLSSNTPFSSNALPESALLPEVGLNPGDAVFAVNDEPTHDGVARHPTATSGLRTPAIYGMTIIGKQGNDYFAIDGMTSAY